VRLKQLAPEVEIVIGGSGIKNFIADHKNLYCEELKNLGIIDHYIMGDGEFAVVEYLKGNFDYIGIDTEKWVQPTNLAQFPTPNYDDYEWDAYESKALPLVDSQGCVRACEFCDIIEHWTKYTYKPAEHIFNEMLELSRRHKIYRFSMRDSLINGNMKEFKKWVTMVADYNNTQPPETQFEWAGFAIVREATHHPEAIWEKIGQSRGTMLLGVESVIQRVRWELGKKFSNEAIDYHLDMARKYKVKLVLMMMCALPGETLEDYEFIKQWFKDRVGYARDPVYRISLSLAAIVPGTEWYRTAQEKSIELGDYPVIWMNKNLGITEEARLKHWKEVRELLTPFNSEKNRDPKSRQKGTLTVLKTDMDSIHI
jgi:radical SAM superfamily enzyme YgiQ (UPF0313 family)